MSKDAAIAGSAPDITPIYFAPAVIGLGLVMDAIYQWRVLGTFYPGEAFIVVLLLAFFPYLLMRGPVDRIARWWMGDAVPKKTR